MSRHAGGKEHALSRWTTSGLIVVLLAASACSELFPTTIRVDEGAISEVRTIGKVLAESETESTWDGVTSISKVLAIDIGDQGHADATTGAYKLLQKHGWLLSIDKHPQSIYMESHKWGHVGLMIKSVGYFDSHGGIDPDEDELVKDAFAKSNSNNMVVLEIEHTDE
ncbi:hypothetical protein [Microbispora corallina]|nr:hypothetical protein [Microbispora corallina]